MNRKLKEVLLRTSILGGIFNSCFSWSYGMDPEQGQEYTESIKHRKTIGHRNPDINQYSGFEKKLRQRAAEKEKTVEKSPVVPLSAQSNASIVTQKISGPLIFPVSEIPPHAEPFVEVQSEETIVMTLPSIPVAKVPEDAPAERGKSQVLERTAVDIGALEAASEVQEPMTDEEYKKALYMLGHKYENDIDCEQNKKAAFRYYKAAAKKGHIKAQYKLGSMHENGQGTPENQKKAFKYFKRAADQGDAGAQYEVGTRYAHLRTRRWAVTLYPHPEDPRIHRKNEQNGVEKNEEEASRYFQLAAIQGNTAAQRLLEMMKEPVAANDAATHQIKIPALIRNPEMPISLTAEPLVPAAEAPVVVVADSLDQTQKVKIGALPLMPAQATTPFAKLQEDATAKAHTLPSENIIAKEPTNENVNLSRETQKKMHRQTVFGRDSDRTAVNGILYHPKLGSSGEPPVPSTKKLPDPVELKPADPVAPTLGLNPPKPTHPHIPRGVPVAKPADGRSVAPVVVTVLNPATSTVAVTISTWTLEPTQSPVSFSAKPIKDIANQSYIKIQGTPPVQNPVISSGPTDSTGDVKATNDAKKESLVAKRRRKLDEKIIAEKAGVLPPTFTQVLAPLVVEPIKNAATAKKEPQVPAAAVVKVPDLATPTVEVPSTPTQPPAPQVIPVANPVTSVTVRKLPSTPTYPPAPQMVPVSADQENPDDLYKLAVRYEIGRGVQKDEIKASQYYQLAAIQGHTEAQYFLGKMYEDGRGVARDENKASYYFRLAADWGNHPHGHLDARVCLIHLKEATVYELSQQITPVLRNELGYRNLDYTNFEEVSETIINHHTSKITKDHTPFIETNPQARLFIKIWGETKRLRERYNASRNALPQQP